MIIHSHLRDHPLGVAGKTLHYDLQYPVFSVSNKGE